MTGGRLYYLRQILAYQRLKRAVDQSIETGRPVEVFLGSGGLSGQAGAVSWSGLAALAVLGRITHLNDRPARAVSADPLLEALAAQALATGKVPPVASHLEGLSAFSAAAASWEEGGGQSGKDAASARLLLGHFSGESVFSLYKSSAEDPLTLAGSDSLPGQAAAYALADEALLGEEVFAAAAYLQPAATARGGFGPKTFLLAQDALRWILCLVIIGGVVLKALSIL